MQRSNHSPAATDLVVNVVVILLSLSGVLMMMMMIGILQPVLCIL